jgi:hypothetical protein
MAMTIIYTAHAKIRMQQRAISADMLEKLLDYGEIRFNGNGTEIVTFPKRVVKRLKDALPHREFVSLEKHLKLYAVLSMEDALVTVGYRTRHLKLH